MFDNRIIEGLSTIYKKEVGMLNTSSEVIGALDNLLTTPQIIEVIIEASYKMLDPLLPNGYVTVGKYIELTHNNPTLTIMSGSISVVLTVTKLDGNKIFMDVACYDEIGLICKGIYERAIVDKEKLMESTYRRAQIKM